MSEDRLKPCPFCGRLTGAISDGGNGIHFRVICGWGSCRAAGPLERCAADALTAWNTRAPLKIVPADPIVFEDDSAQKGDEE